MNASDAERWNDTGRARAREGRKDDAIDAYRRAITADPGWSTPWYNLGLIHKYDGEWDAALECNRRATELNPQDGDARWNLGIAATALGLWGDARSAWRGCGIDVPPGAGPIDMALGLVPIRLAPAGAAEVVWCERLDPARAVIRNVPLPASGRRWRDLLLHDGAINGYRMLGDREVGVFDELELLEASEFATFEVLLEALSEEERERLESIADDLGAAAEDWSRSIRYLCRQCSEGRPHADHDADLRADRPDLAFGVAARDEAHLDRVLSGWAGAVGGERVRGWSAAISASPRPRSRP